MVRFSEYMSSWLYASEGYYAKHKEIGKEGDFYTAVSSSMFFGGSIAKRLLMSIEEGFLPNDATIVEIGAHKGYLLADIIQFIYTLNPKLLEQLSFVVVEPFEENIQAQRQYFQDSFGEAVHVKHVSSLKELTCKAAFIVANEIFDAFPCELIKDGQMLYMDEHEPYFDRLDEEVGHTCKRYGIHKGEVGMGYESFAKEMTQACERFEFITFDYGDRLPRNDFSLRVYEKHQVYPFFALTDFIKDKGLQEEKSLKELFGKSDITYDVCFDHLIGAFEDAGVMLYSYAPQMRALVDFGLIELLEIMRANAKEEHYNEELRRVKTLIDPAFLGERFKMAHFRKEEKDENHT